jgi:hypothetical protein
MAHTNREFLKAPSSDEGKSRHLLHLHQVVLSHSKRHPNVSQDHVLSIHVALVLPFATMAVNEEELHNLQTKIAPTILQRLGASSTTSTPTVIRHGPTDLAVMDIVDMRTELGIKMIKCLASSCRLLWYRSWKAHTDQPWPLPTRSGH